MWHFYTTYTFRQIKNKRYEIGTLSLVTGCKKAMDRRKTGDGQENRPPSEIAFPILSVFPKVPRLGHYFFSLFQKLECKRNSVQL